MQTWAWYPVGALLVAVTLSGCGGGGGDVVSERELARQVAQHPWWAKKPTQEEVEFLAQNIAATTSRNVVFLDDQARLLIVTSPLPYKASDPKNERIDNATPKELRERRHIFLDMGSYPANQWPSSYQVLRDIKSKLDQASAAPASGR